MSNVRTASCRCGRVTFQLEGEPLITSACHCGGCQRMTASAYSLSIGYPRSALHVTAGEDQLSRGGLQQEHRHFYCGFCKSWLFSEIAGVDDFVNVRTTMLDHPPTEPPFVEMCRSESFDWAKTGAERSYDSFPAMEEWPTLISEYQSRQV